MTVAVAFGVELLVRSSLLIALAWLAAVAMQSAGASAAMRHLAWLGAIASLLLLPLLMATLPVLPLTALPVVAEPGLMAMPVMAGAPLAPVQSVGAPLTLWLLLFGYSVVAAALLARLAAARLALCRVWRDADLADQQWNATLSRAAGELGLRRPVALRFARAPVMPITWGTWVPKILLPPDARGWDMPKRHVVLMHELAHIRRRDSLSLSAGSLACAIYWLHPGVWFAARRLRLEQEIAADDLALRAGVPACHYAENLLELAAAFRLPTPAMAGQSQLERRLRAIVGSRSRRPLGPAFAGAAGTVALAVTSVTATAIPVSAAAELQPISGTPGPGSFRSVFLRSGGEVVIRHGDRPSVSVRSGAPRVFITPEGRLVIDNRGRPDRHPRVEIVAPALETVSVEDGGRVAVQKGFPRQDNIAAAVVSGGEIDLRPFPVGRVAGEVNRGGQIAVRPGHRLDAEVRNGGIITYWGDPQVRTSVQDGGVVVRGDTQ